MAQQAKNYTTKKVKYSNFDILLELKNYPHPKIKVEHLKYIHDFGTNAEYWYGKGNLRLTASSLRLLGEDLICIILNIENLDSKDLLEFTGKQELRSVELEAMLRFFRERTNLPQEVINDLYVIKNTGNEGTHFHSAQNLTQDSVKESLLKAHEFVFAFFREYSTKQMAAFEKTPEFIFPNNKGEIWKKNRAQQLVTIENEYHQKLQKDIQELESNYLDFIEKKLRFFNNNKKQLEFEERIDYLLDFVNEYKKLADKGNSIAQFQLGFCYDSIGLEYFMEKRSLNNHNDWFVKSYDCWKKAAENGNIDAVHLLAHYHDTRSVLSYDEITKYVERLIIHRLNDENDKNDEAFQASILMYTGDNQFIKERANQYLNDFIKKEHPIAWLALGYRCELEGDFDNAIKNYQKYMDNSDSIEFYFLSVVESYNVLDIPICFYDLDSEWIQTRINLCTTKKNK